MAMMRIRNVDDTDWIDVDPDANQHGYQTLMEQRARARDFRRPPGRFQTGPTASDVGWGGFMEAFKAKEEDAESKGQKFRIDTRGLGRPVPPGGTSPALGGLTDAGRPPQRPSGNQSAQNPIDAGLAEAERQLGPPIQRNPRFQAQVQQAMQGLKGYR